MLVKELIEELQKLDPNLIVFRSTEWRPQVLRYCGAEYLTEVVSSETGQFLYYQDVVVAEDPDPIEVCMLE